MRQREVYGEGRFCWLTRLASARRCRWPRPGRFLTALVGDGPALILAPSTLCEQWLGELIEKLGRPHRPAGSRHKRPGQTIRATASRAAPEGIARCPYRVAMVSTGLMMRSDAVERRGSCSTAAPGQVESPYGIVVLDEAHKARGAENSGRHLGSRTSCSTS